MPVAPQARAEAARAEPSVSVEVLGPLRLTVDRSTVDVRGPKRRAVLTLLAFAGGRTVTIDALLDALWPSEGPESGRQALYSHVSRLRVHLGAASDRLQTRPDGYQLELDTDEFDLAQAQALRAAGRTLVAQDPHGAFDLFRQARELWRGPVLADLTDFLPVANAVTECAALHREITDGLTDAAIRAGRAGDVLGMATESVAADPLREPAALLLMRTLAATGQAAEALRVGRDYRRRLADETGLDPSPELATTERDIAAGAAGPASDDGTRTAGVRRAVGPSGPLIGRADELTIVRELLKRERLVSLVGPGGVGKTRLALELAREATATLLLAPVTDPAAIPHALAATLRLEVVQGDVLAACLALLGDRPGLLLIDNCEHVSDAVRDTVDAVLAACPHLHILTTSREPLGLAAEHVVRLGPLPLPDPEQDPAAAASVAMFLDRAARIRPQPTPRPADLRIVADIVRRLDGMPLAIELAAGRLSTFSLVDLHRRLDRFLDLLGGPRPSGDARHRTLRATVEWSYQLLLEDERRVFRHLAIFVDGVDLDTAERIAAEHAPRREPGAVLARLVDASMIEPHFDNGTRYRMLETLRAFGLDRLAAAGETDAAVDRLLTWAADLAAWIETTLVTEHEPEADQVLRRELPNLRAAWRHARARPTVGAAVAIIGRLYDAVAYRDLLELRSWARELAEDPGLAGHPMEATVLGIAAEAVYHSGDYERAAELASLGFERARGPADTWYSLSSLSVAELARGAYAEAIARALGAVEVSGRPRDSLGLAALAAAYAGDLDQARRWNDEAFRAASSPGFWSWSEYVAGEIDSITAARAPAENTAAMSRESAEQHYLQAIEHARAAGTTFLGGIAAVGLQAVRASAGRFGEALAGYRQVIDYFATTGNWTHLWVTLRNLAELLRRLGDDEPATLLDAAADRAPDAPADDAHVDREGTGAELDPRVRDRAGVLRIARDAIDRNLRGVRSHAAS